MSGTKKAMSLHDRHAAERAASCIRPLNASLFTLTIRHLTYIHSMRRVRKVGFCIANNQNRMCREYMSEESGPVKETIFSRSRGRANMEGIRDAFVARRMVTRFNRAI
jgi:hypothetical protein